MEGVMLFEGGDDETEGVAVIVEVTEPVTELEMLSLFVIDGVVEGVKLFEGVASLDELRETVIATVRDTVAVADAVSLPV